MTVPRAAAPRVIEKLRAHAWLKGKPFEEHTDGDVTTFVAGNGHKMEIRRV